MREAMTAILLTILMAFSFNFDVKAQSNDDQSQEDHGNSQDSQRGITYYEEQLEGFMGMDIRNFLEIIRIVKHPTEAELQADWNEQVQLNLRNLSTPGYTAHRKKADSMSVKVLRKYGTVFGELQGSFRLKDGNTAYYFLLKKPKNTFNPTTPGVPNAVDVFGTPVKSVLSASGRNEVSPYAVRTVPGYEIEPRYDSVLRGNYICKTYLVADPSGKLFFWSHKGDWPACLNGHRNSTR